LPACGTTCRSISLALARPKERDQLVDLRLLLEPASQRPRASDQLTLRFSWPLPVATTVVVNSGPPARH
jgi:hypothetical protein